MIPLARFLFALASILALCLILARWVETTAYSHNF